MANGLQPLRAPFMRMGSSMVEEVVCYKCLAVHIDIMNGFWVVGAGHPTHACRRCGVDFSGVDGKFVESVVVQHLPKGDGSWTQSAICAGCFKVFEECCRKAKAMGKTK